MSIQSFILSSYAEEGIAMAKVWLITGSGNGLGRDIAEAALAAGDSIVAGARRTEELAPVVAQYGERVKPVKLEVRDEAAAKAAVQLAVDNFGRLDVLVNNAGYGQFAPFEQMGAQDFQGVVDTCFCGGGYTTRAAVRKAPDFLPEYEAAVGSFLKMLRSLEGRSEGDPRRIADVIVQLANSDEVPVRLILGVDAEKRVQQAEAARASEAEKWRHLTVSTVFEDGRFDGRLYIAKSGINS